MKNFDFGLLLDFPGILILIGVVLLIVAVVIGVASKNNAKKKKNHLASRPAEVEPVSQMPSNNMPPILPNNQQFAVPQQAGPSMPEEMTKTEQTVKPISELTPQVEQPVQPISELTPQVEQPVQPISELTPQVEQPVQPISELTPQVEQPNPMPYGGVNPVDTVNANMGINQSLSETKEEPVVIPSIVNEPAVETENKKDEIETL